MHYFNTRRLGGLVLIALLGIVLELPTTTAFGQALSEGNNNITSSQTSDGGNRNNLTSNQQPSPLPDMVRPDLPNQTIPNLTMSTVINTTYAFDSQALDNATLRSRLRDALVDQFTDGVYTLARSNYEANVTAELRDDNSNTTAVITGIAIIVDVLNSQAEDLVDDLRNQTPAGASRELRIDTEIAMSCTLVRPSFEECDAVVSIR